MRKSKKLLCLGIVAATAMSIGFSVGCDNTYNSKALEGGLGYTAGQQAISNGGFAVEKGNYIYFINGIETNAADNTFGKVEKGSLMRISKSDFSARNYANVQTVVPSIIYSGDKTSGIYIYGDYVYYTTPSVDRDGSGNVLNTYLDFKCTKLDGTGTKKDYLYQSASASVVYRYVEVDGTVYLMYVENKAQGESTVNNIRSLNTSTGEDTLLAYNVSSYMFSDDLENATVYYTMNVTNYIGSDKASLQSGYNQVYKVSANATQKNEYDFSYLEEDFDFEENPVYVNCGTLLMDGIGNSDTITQFNANYNNGTSTPSGHEAYTYTLNSYSNDGTLYYTRKTSSGSVFMYAEESKTESWANPETTSAYCLLIDATKVTAVNSYKFLKVDNKTKVMFIENNTIMLGEMNGSNIVNEYPITKSTTSKPEMLFTYEDADLGHSYIYYSLTGGNGHNIYRVAYDGALSDYTQMPTNADDLTYQSIGVLDLDANSAWYNPEIFDGQIIFPSVIDDMSDYNYIQVCDLRNAQNKSMTNEQLKALNEQYEGIKTDIGNYSATDYAYLQNALIYAFNLGTTDKTGYLADLIKAYMEINGWNEEHTYSKQSVEVYNNFLAGEGDWAKYTENFKQINGKKVNSNMRDYYYSVIGKMTDADFNDYVEHMQSHYFESYPKKDLTWWESLTTAQRVWFIIGVSLGGLVVIAAAVLVPMLIIRYKRNKKPVYRKTRKVDTSDDKSVDVYGTDTENNDEE